MRTYHCHEGLGSRARGPGTQPQARSSRRFSQCVSTRNRAARERKARGRDLNAQGYEAFAWPVVRKCKGRGKALKLSL